MNSLEFIDKEIAHIKRIIKTTQKMIDVFTENKRDTTELQVHFTVLEEHLNSLHQIKTILEAWEVVQGTIVEGQDGDGHYCYIETVYFTGEEGEKVTKGLYKDETR